MKKLWHSFVKELILSTRSFYFYIELFMALFFLFLLIFVIPENFNSKADEYIYLDMPQAAKEGMITIMEENDEDGLIETAEFDLNDQTIVAQLYESNEKRIYLFDSEETAVQIADNERSFGAVVRMNEQGEVRYTYYMQGYETERLRNLYLVFHNESTETIEAQFNQQEIRPLHDSYTGLTDRQNVLPSFLTFNGSLMGLFIIAAYIFLDKKEGVITAYAVSPSPVWQYLLSKMGVIMLTSTISSLIIVIPIMGGQPNYPLLILFLLTSGFAASAAGLILTSYYNDIAEAFGALYLMIIILMLPTIAYFIPTWDPTWIHYIPTYTMLEAFKEAILPQGDATYILQSSGTFLFMALVLFWVANGRFKKSLSI